MKRDPDKVPAFPVINLEVTDDGQVLVDGRPIPRPDGTPPALAGVEAVAQAVQNKELDAARVRAIAPEGDFTMVVWADGEAVDTTSAPAQPAAPSRRRIIQLTAATAGAVVLVAAGTIAVVAVTGNDSEPVPTASVVALPGEGANLPVQAPAGYGQTAIWSLPVSSGPQVLITPDGGLLVAPVENDRITILDPATGTTIWEGRDYVDDVHLSHFGDRPVVAADGRGTLYMWPLDTVDAEGMAPTTIDLGSDQAEVTYNGPAPLITLPDQTVALLDGQTATPTRRDVPVGATAVGATSERVIAVGSDAWWTITADADPVRHHLPRPEQAIGDPTASIAIDGTQLAVVWSTAEPDDDVLALVDLTSNAIRATGTISSKALPPDAEPLRDGTSATMTLGTVLLDVGASPVIADLGDITPEAVIGRTVYGTSKSKPAVATVSSEGVDLKVAEGSGETEPIAELTEDVAFVVTSKVDETFLYALPRIEGTNP